MWLPGEAPPHAAAAVNDPAVRAAIEKLDGRVVRVRGKLRRHGR
ncbi:MAG: 50S ribosomal protein L23 [Chloroflexi bacterium]|nr:MAG: 50S ribosomal protein L23 [Chloroflexota bacterium]